MSPSEVDRLVDTYLDHLKVERGLSGHTISAYRRDLSRYARFLRHEQIRSIDQVTTPLVTEYAAGLARAGEQGPGLAPASIARAVVAIRSLHRFAVEEGVSTDDPTAEVQPPQQGTRLPKALSVDQVDRLLAAPDTSEPTGLRDRALLELLYGTGARVSEVCDLDVDDVSRLLGPDADPDTGLRLVGKGNKERVVPVGRWAREALEGWLVRGRPVLATRSVKNTPALLLNARGNRLSRQSAWAILQDCAAKALLEVEISPHTLRHSCATHLLDGGADVRVVQELLGHASVTTTQIYTLVTLDHLRETYLTAHPRAY